MIPPAAITHGGPLIPAPIPQLLSLPSALDTESGQGPKFPFTLPTSHHHHVAALPNKPNSATAPKLGIFHFLLDLFLPPFKSNPAIKDEPEIKESREKRSQWVPAAGAAPWEQQHDARCWCHPDEGTPGTPREGHQTCHQRGKTQEYWKFQL